MHVKIYQYIRNNNLLETLWGKLERRMCMMQCFC